MRKLKYIEIDGKEVILKKSGDSFRVVKPWKNKDGTLNWFNILTGGSWTNLLVVAFIVFVVLGTLYEYSHNINILLNCFSDPIQLARCQRAFGPETIINFIP